jgi:hypothetical protein
MKKRPTQTQPERGSKKPYSTPALAVHGSLRSLTAAKHGNRGDGAGKPKTKTTSGP